jgi:hypothetical protein
MGGQATTIGDQLEELRVDAQTRADAQSLAAVVDRTAQTWFSWGSFVFSALATTTLITTIFGAVDGVQLAALFTLLATLAAGALKLQDFEELAETHHKTAADLQAVVYDIKDCRARFSRGEAVTSAEVKRLYRRIATLQKGYKRAPGWVYSLIARRVTSDKSPS